MLQKDSPWAMRKTLNWIKRQYGDIPIYVSTNGVADSNGKLNDTDRVNYHRNYIDEMLKGSLHAYISFTFKLGSKGYHLLIFFSRTNSILFII